MKFSLFTKNLCQLCAHELEAPASVCPSCESTLHFEPLVVSRRKLIPGFASCAYLEPSAKLLHNFKLSGSQQTASYLAEKIVDQLSDSWAEDFRQRNLVLVAVPSSKTTTRQRGFVPAVLLAKQLAKQLRKRFKLSVWATNSLWFERKVKDQAGLNLEGRAQNLTHSMRAARIAGSAKTPIRVVLVDDVVTTGSTMREAARALAEVGAAPISFLAFAETFQKVTRQI